MLERHCTLDRRTVCTLPETVTQPLLLLHSPLHYLSSSLRDLPLPSIGYLSPFRRMLSKIELNLLDDRIVTSTNSTSSGRRPTERIAPLTSFGVCSEVRQNRRLRPLSPLLDQDLGL